MNMDTNKTKGQKALKKEIFDWLDTIVIAVIAVIFIFTALFRVATIVGDSMQNTFFENERIVITKLFYKPQVGDVVVISRNADNSTDKESYQEPIIKRVIATGGQYVDIDFKSGNVYVGYTQSDMELLYEPYIKIPTYNKGDVEFPLYVPEGTVFVLGDNRAESLDSRYSSIGLVDEKNILGKAVFRIYPFTKIGAVGNYE